MGSTMSIKDSFHVNMTKIYTGKKTKFHNPIKHHVTISCDQASY